MLRIGQTNTMAKQKSEKKLADERCLKLWKQIIQLRDIVCQRPNCPFCFNNKNANYLQAHHIVNRTCWPVRHDSLNGLLICRSSHSYWCHSKNPFVMQKVLDFYNSLYCKDKKMSLMTYLDMRRHNQAKLDYKLIELELRQQLKDILGGAYEV